MKPGTMYDLVRTRCWQVLGAMLALAAVTWLRERDGRRGREREREREERV